MELDEEPQRPQTVPVCQRCRHRKQKCDPNTSGCKPCLESGNECYVEDPETGRTVPRAYVQRLEDHALNLRQALKKLRTDPNAKAEATPTPAIAPEQRQPVPLKPNRRYLGSSSGIAFIEYAITFAKTQGILDGAQDFTPSVKSHADTDPKQLIQILTPSPTPSKLDRETVSRLYDYFSITQWTYRILTRAEFDHHLSCFFSGTSDEHPESAIVIHMISAISTFYLGTVEGNAMASNLAEMQYERALHLLPTILPHRTIETLQIILLVLLYSLVNPQKSVTWHLLGAALRLATFLRLHEDDAATELTTKDADVRRNLFWSLYSIDRAVGNTLGRPTALQDGDIRTPFPEISPNSTQDSSSAFNTSVSRHCFHIRRLQSEVADVLYQKTRPMPADWPADIQGRLDEWLAEAPMSQASPQMQEWINHAYHNLVMFINRPSLIGPTLSEGASERSFASASKVLKLYAKMHSRNAIDCTWMAFHWLFLAGITHLFCIWTDPEIRATADWKEIMEDLQRTRMMLSAMVEHWRHGKRILDIYCQLCEGTVRRFVEVTPITVTESEYEEGTAVLENWSGNNMHMSEIDAAPPTIQAVDVSSGPISTLQFEDILMDDDLGYWLDQPNVGVGTQNGSAAPYSSLDYTGNELDPWFYRI